MKRKIKIFSLMSIFLVVGLALSQGDLNKKRNRPGIVYWHGDADKKLVALTFDDGPNDPYTSEILDILKKENVHATFFLVGQNVDKNPELARRISEEGHVIGNHSYTHPNMIMESDKNVRKEILKTEEAIVRATGVKPYLFRPPFGYDDPLTVRQSEKLGYVMVKWSLSARDWRKPGPTRIVSRVLRYTGNGTILLMHDGDKLRYGGDRSQTVTALPALIHELHARGFEFVTVPEMLNLDGPPAGQLAYAGKTEDVQLGQRVARLEMGVKQ